MQLGSDVNSLILQQPLEQNSIDMTGKERVTGYQDAQNGTECTRSTQYDLSVRLQKVEVVRSVCSACDKFVVGMYVPSSHFLFEVPFSTACHDVSRR